MKKIFCVIALIVLMATAAAYWLYSDFKTYIATPLNFAENSSIVVDKGLSFNGLANKLKSKSENINIYYLKFYARQTGLGRKIKAGEYALTADMTPITLLKKITSGRSINYNFTIVEGSNYKQLLAALESNQYLKNDIKGLSPKQLLEQLETEYTHLEGLFLAETYSFEKNSSALALLKRSHKMLIETLEPAWQARDKKLPYTSAYDALIMASIVEKETARVEERPIIAGVFVRRLNIGMRLQTDPTVIYGMGDNYKGNIRRSDLRKPTPYNTYTISGLPPTPIAMVGPDAITAALNPKKGKALYFVAKGDGTHYFSSSLKEHNNAVRKYQLSRRKDYRSSP